MRDKAWVTLIGSGLALSSIHNNWLTKAATDDRGETLFFLPAFGYLLLIMGTGMFLLHNWEKVREVGWGDKMIVVPLLVIVGAIGLSGITADGLQSKIAPIGAGVSLFALYLAARVLGKNIFLPFAVGAAIASFGIILHSIIHPGQETGGFIFERNFDIATGYILLGAALFVHRWQWLLAGLAVIALLLSGAPEAAFAMGVLLVVVLIRRDWDKRMAVLGGTVVLLIVVVFTTGWGHSLYSYITDTIRGEPVTRYTAPDGKLTIVSPLAVRGLVIGDMFESLEPLGDGYNLTGFTEQTVHNVPLIIVQQLGWPGILAGLLWLWISFWCLVKTRWKYAWALMLTLSVFDHYIWTQLAPVYWALIGISTTSTIKSDLLFRRAG